MSIDNSAAMKATRTTTPVRLNSTIRTRCDGRRVVMKVSASMISAV